MLSRLNPLAYKLFLSTFRIRRRGDQLPPESSTGMSHNDWTKCLGEDPFTVTNYLINDGLLVRASLADHLDKFTYDEIKKLAEEKGLSTQGSRSDVTYRLSLYHNQEDIWKEIKFNLFELSDTGEKLVENSLSIMWKDGMPLTAESIGIPQDKIKRILLYVLNAAAGGIIGNRLDAAFISVVKKVKKIEINIKSRFDTLKEKTVTFIKPGDRKTVSHTQKNMTLNAISQNTLVDPFTSIILNLAFLVNRIASFVKNKR